MQIPVEGRGKGNPARDEMGPTRCDKLVVFDGSARHRGWLLDVKIPGAGTFTVYGRVDDGRPTRLSYGYVGAPAAR